ncbi:hypothetical protein K474DRAFT_170544 [Panus rudis PR-1116 ss-1]|nr:hypothetical protein K474DRAFT_170544 [Panus rudis PR-1116 ss-1]
MRACCEVSPQESQHVKHASNLWRWFLRCCGTSRVSRKVGGWEWRRHRLPVLVFGSQISTYWLSHPGRVVPLTLTLTRIVDLPPGLSPEPEESRTRSLLPSRIDKPWQLSLDNIMWDIFRKMEGSPCGLSPRARSNVAYEKGPEQLQL